MRRRTFVASTPLVVTAALLGVACGGSTGSAITGPTADAGSTASGGGGGSEAGPPSNVDGGTTAPDSGKEPTKAPNELPAPDCHDLDQLGTFVEATANPDPPPAPIPLPTIKPGAYVVTAHVDYDGESTIPPATDTRTTVFFTATKQYYVSEEKGAEPYRLTLEWAIQEGKLVRKVLCSESRGQIGNVVSYRVSTSPNGFTVYVPRDGRIQTFRYDRVQ